MSDPLGPVTIGAREIYDQVIRLSASVERLSDQHADTQRDVSELKADHEARIRALERGRWPLPSLAVLVSLVSLLIVVIPMLVH